MPQGGGAYPRCGPRRCCGWWAACLGAPLDVGWLSTVWGSTAARAPVKRLSGGQQQRLSLAARGRAARAGVPRRADRRMDPQGRRLVWELIEALRGTGCRAADHAPDRRAEARPTRWYRRRGQGDGPGQPERAHATAEQQSCGSALARGTWRPGRALPAGYHAAETMSAATSCRAGSPAWLFGDHVVVRRAGRVATTSRWPAAASGRCSGADRARAALVSRFETARSPRARGPGRRGGCSPRSPAPSCAWPSATASSPAHPADPDRAAGRAEHADVVPLPEPRIDAVTPGVHRAGRLSTAFNGRPSRWATTAATASSAGWPPPRSPAGCWWPAGSPR